MKLIYPRIKIANYEKAKNIADFKFNLKNVVLVSGPMRLGVSLSLCLTAITREQKKLTRLVTLDHSQQ